MLGAAGAIESAFTVLSLVKQMVPPTVNLQQVDEVDDQMESFQHVMAHAMPVENMEFAMNNSFGFGGTNASVVFRLYNNH